jgi:hypothetical protein
VIKLIELKSTNLKAAGHDPATGTLKVQFHNGAVWEYQGVPADVAGGLLEASSPGKYLYEHIRGQYPAQAVVEEPAAAEQA